MNVLFINAIADDLSVKAFVNEDGKIQVVFSGSCNVRDYLTSDLKEYYGAEVEYLTTTSQDNREQIQIKRPDIIFNEVSEPDSHIGALQKVEHFINQLKCPVINAPVSVVNTRRETLADKLSSLKTARVPGTIRIRPELPEQVLQLWRQYFPGKSVLIRGTGDHGGCSTIRLDSDKDIALLHRLPMDGRDYLLSEYVDYVSDDGLYRKYRIVLIDGDIFLRHMIISDHWMVHSDGRSFMENRPELCQEEAHNLGNFANIISDEVIADLTEINRLIGAEYLGLDCNINGNKLTVFELNANMNILTGNKVNGALCDEAINNIKAALVKLVGFKSGSEKS